MLPFFEQGWIETNRSHLQAQKWPDAFCSSLWPVTRDCDGVTVSRTSTVTLYRTLSISSVY